MKTQKFDKLFCSEVDAVNWLADGDEGWKVEMIEKGQRECSGNWETTDADCTARLTSPEGGIELVVRFQFEVSVWSLVGSTRRGNRGWKVRGSMVYDDKSDECEVEACVGYGRGRGEAMSAAGAERSFRKQFAHCHEVTVGRVEPLEAVTASFSGSTWYKNADGKWCCFDRYGVEDSFYGTSQSLTVKQLIRRESKRVAEARERQARSEAIPDGFGWSVTPETKADIASRLAKGGSYEFCPRGFGIGKRLSGSKRGGYCGAVKASADVCKFFEAPVGSLWVSTFEHD